MKLKKIKYGEKSKIMSYNFGDGFYIDIVDKGGAECLEAWIYHEDYGIKELMFGGGDEYGSFFRIVEKNFPAYRDAYVYRMNK